MTDKCITYYLNHMSEINDIIHKGAEKYQHMQYCEVYLYKEYKTRFVEMLEHFNYLGLRDIKTRILNYSESRDVSTYKDLLHTYRTNKSYISKLYDDLVELSTNPEKLNISHFFRMYYMYVGQWFNLLNPKALSEALDKSPDIQTYKGHLTDHLTNIEDLPKNIVDEKAVLSKILLNGINYHQQIQERKSEITAIYNTLPDPIKFSKTNLTGLSHKDYMDIITPISKLYYKFPIENPDLYKAKILKKYSNKKVKSNLLKIIFTENFK